MASGSNNLTTYYAKRIIGDAAAANAANALLQTGSNITTDTWILHRTNRQTNYGIIYNYDYVNQTLGDADKIEFVGKSIVTAWVQLDIGNALFAGKITIGTSTFNSDYDLYVNGTAGIENNLTVNGSIWFGAGTSSGKAILGYNTTYPNYGIWFFDETVDVMTLSASGNADSKTGADLGINVHGAGTLTNRNNRIPHTGNTTGTVGSGTQPVYVNAGTITNTTYALNATVPVGATNVFPYYSAENTLSTIATANGALFATNDNGNPSWGTLPTAQGGTGNTSYTATRLLYTNTDTKIASTTITSNGEYLGNVSYLSVNTAHQTDYRLYVNGTTYFNGNTTHNGIDYFANGTTYYINNSGTANLYGLTANSTALFKSTLRVQNSTTYPQIEFYSSDTTGSYGALMYVNMPTTNSIHRMDRIIWRENSYNSTSGAVITNYYEDYRLPSVNADRTATASYDIRTSKSSAYNVDTATHLSSFPNNTTTFYRGDKTWSSRLTGGLDAAYIGVTNTTSTNGYGISLYNGATASAPTYGIMFQGTGTFGKHGAVTSDWATYFTMNDNTARGWIFRRGSTNVASISGGGTCTLDGGLEIKGHIAGDSSTTGHGLYSGGAYHNAYNNIILQGDATTGSSGIAFVSSKGTSTINQPSDRAFIQYHAHGVTTYTAENTAPTLATSGEANVLVIGVGNDATDTVRLQTPGRTGLLHQVAANAYVIPDTNNTTGSVGGTTTPVYVDGGVIKTCTAYASASVNYATSSGSCTGNAATATTASACSGNAATATRIKGNLTAATSNVNRNIWISDDASASGIPRYASNFYFNPSTSVLCLPAGGRVTKASGNLYIGDSGNSGWVLTQDICSHSGAGDTYWSARVGGVGHFKQLYGAVWNDYAEMRNVPEAQVNINRICDDKGEIERDYPNAGRCVAEIGNGSMALTTKRLQKGCKIISDTFGFCIGETEDSKTPIAVTGRVLAYPYESITELKQHIGDCVCSGPNGTISIMTDEEKVKYPECIVGTISEIPTYSTWKCGNAITTPIKVNGRIWIYVK